MPLTTFTVGWTETVNLDRYNNAKPTLTRTITVGPEEDAAAREAQEQAEVKALVQEWADQALEQHGHAARYSKDPRFDVYVERYDQQSHIVIVPSGVRPHLDGASRSHPNVRKYRLPAAQAYAAEKADEATSIDGAAVIYDASENDAVLATASEAITAARIAYEVARAEAKRKQEEEWQQEIARRDAQREADRQTYARAQRAPAGEPDPDFADDEDDDDEE